MSRDWDNPRPPGMPALGWPPSDPITPPESEPCPTCGQVREHRSHASHGHFFASVQEAFNNLPEDIAGDFGDAEHLRKWCLIKAGYRDERTLACSSKAEALRLASFIRPMDGFAVVLVREATVTVYTARSQSLRAMGKDEFQKSKDSVFDVLAKLIGVDVAELSANAGQSA